MRGGLKVQVKKLRGRGQLRNGGHDHHLAGDGCRAKEKRTIRAVVQVEEESSRDVEMRREHEERGEQI